MEAANGGVRVVGSGCVVFFYYCAEAANEFGQAGGIDCGIFDEADGFTESGECVYEWFCCFAELPGGFHGGGGAVGGDVV